MIDGLIDENGEMRLSRIIPPAFRHGCFLRFNGRYRLFKGARNTGKSFTIIGEEPILKILNNPLVNVVMIRQNLNTHKQSTYANICGRINDLGLNTRFDMRENPSPEITFKETGQKIVFKGFNDPTTINSIAFSVGYLTDIYIEEAFEIPLFDDFQKLDKSLRGILPEGMHLQITMCFNAWNKSHWLYEEFFKGLLEDDYATLDDPSIKYIEYMDRNWVGPYGTGLYLNTTTFKANPYRDVSQVDVAAGKAKEKTPDTYAVEFLGMWGNSSASTYEEFDDSCIITLEEAKTKYGTRENTDIRKTGFATFAIGIDTGLSDGNGHIRKVLKNQKTDERVKAANTMMLIGVTSDYESIVCIDEFYHTNIERNVANNTESDEHMDEAEVITMMVDTIFEWCRTYRMLNNGLFYGSEVNVYIDNADVGFIMGFMNEVKIRRRECVQNGLVITVNRSTRKLSVQSRVDWEKIMFAWGNMKIVNKCKNIIREIRNARRGEHGEARQDEDDHCLTAFEYGYTPLLPDVHMWKQFKER